jgi:pre-mRNA-splicing factor SPF27
MEYVPFSRTEVLIEEPLPPPPPSSRLLRLPAPNYALIDPREHGTVLDALPYIDVQYSDETMREEVDKLISAEMARSTKSPEEYLSERGLHRPELRVSALVQAEFERIESGKPQVAVNMFRYKVEPPAEEDKNSLEAWRIAVDNAFAQVQATRVRVTNLELSNKFGPNAWKLHAEQLQTLNNGVEQNIQEVKQDIENINRKRKSEQTKAGGKLEHLTQKWTTTIQKTNELEGVCYMLEKEVKKLRKQAVKKGVEPPRDDVPVPIDEDV